jgi:chromosome segregation ATPase
MREGDTQETWAIPLSDLFNAGLMKGKAKTSTAEQPEPELNETIALLKAENQGLKTQVALLERNLEDLREEIRFSRRAIETAEAQNTRRRFWQRNT